VHGYRASNEVGPDYVSVTSAPPEHRSASPPTVVTTAAASAAVPPRGRTWWRLLLGCVSVLLCSAGVAATVVLEQVHTLRDALSQNKALSLPSGTLAPTAWGAPETLLLSEMTSDP